MTHAAIGSVQGAAADHCVQPDADLRRKIEFLGRSDSHSGRPTRVAIVETHFSWVFLTDQHAYKLKKPVRGDGFDLRSLEARRRNAITELHLNRRLAPDVYLSVVPLTADDSRLGIAGPGRPVDWLVKMIRLDADRMLDRRLARGGWRYGEIEALAERLASFFATAKRVHLSPAQQLARIRVELRLALAAAERAAEPQLLAAMKPLVRRLDAFLARHSRLLRQRIRQWRIVDGHGDLRPEHIAVDGKPRIIDCIEFRSDLRQLDPASELAYLALECRRLGGPEIEQTLLRRYRERSGDLPPPVLVRFYRTLNAVIRARIAILHLAEPGARTRPELIVRAAGYLAIARAASFSSPRRASGRRHARALLLR